jgi:putative endonuclease
VSFPLRWSAYMVRCADGSLYTGISTCVARRLRQHNGELAGGARYTAARRPVVLVYEGEAGTAGTALREERRIKALTRSEKLDLIAGARP